MFNKDEIEFLNKNLTPLLRGLKSYSKAGLGLKDSFKIETIESILKKINCED